MGSLPAQTLTFEAVCVTLPVMRDTFLTQPSRQSPVRKMELGPMKMKSHSVLVSMFTMFCEKGV